VEIMALDYISDNEKILLEKLCVRHEHEMFFGVSKEILTKRKQRNLLNEDNRKYAYVYVSKTRKMVMVDNKTMIAYKLESDIPVATEMIQPYTKFDRWCTGHDL
jgi:hypothetical protein